MTHTHLWGPRHPGEQWGSSTMKPRSPRSPPTPSPVTNGERASSVRTSKHRGARLGTRPLSLVPLLEILSKKSNSLVECGGLKGFTQVTGPRTRTSMWATSAATQTPVSTSFSRGCSWHLQEDVHRRVCTHTHRDTHTGIHTDTEIHTHRDT